MIKKQFALSKEEILFRIFLFIHLLPVLSLTPFVTLDGPAHLFNATLIRQLITGSSANASSFLMFNPVLEPNWIGHAFMALLLGFLPPLMVEKIVLTLILLLTAIGYRKLILKLDASNGWLSWSVFPFLCNFVFCLGFFNFSIGFALLPFVLVWWLNNKENGLTIKNIASGLLLMTILFFSHLVMFLYAGFCMGLLSLNQFSKSRIKEISNEIIQLLIISSPGLILTILFGINSGAAGYRGEVSYLPWSDLLTQIKDARMFIFYDYDKEKVYTIFFTFLIVSTTIISLFKRAINRYQFTMLLIVISSLIMIFTIPDSLASGGIVSVRIIQLFFVCWCLWLATLRMPKWLSAAFGIGSLAFSLFMIYIHYPVQKSLSEDARHYCDAAKNFSSKDLVAPLNYSPNWLHANMGSYMGAISGAFILDNYEPTQGHFPLIWKKGMNPEETLGNYCRSTKPCIYPEQFKKATGFDVNYFTGWDKPSTADNDSCSLHTDSILNSNYLIQSQGENPIIYKRK
jgi:hypothetical protein